MEDSTPHESVEKAAELVRQAQPPLTANVPEPWTASRPSRPFARFLIAWFTLPILFYFAAFPLVRTASYEHWSPSTWGPLLDYAFHAGPPNADVVVFGDSSAFIGIDPRLMNQQLGLHSVVLPGTVGSLPVINDLPLVRYLARNRPPRLLVLYFSSWDLDYSQIENLRPFEGEEMLLRQADRSAIASFARRQPIEIALFPLRLYSTFEPSMLSGVVHGTDRENVIANAFGHHDDYDPFPANDSSCIFPGKLLDRTSEGTVRSLMDKYSPRMQVMVYLAPVPDCQNVQSLLNRSYSEVDAVPPATLPAADFLADPYFSHVRPPFVPTATKLLITAVAGHLRPQE